MPGARRTRPTRSRPDLFFPAECRTTIRNGALVAISHSGGKDSQAMTILLSRIVPREQLLVVHAPLGGVEWPGTVEHIEATIPPGVPLILAPIASGKTLLEGIEARGRFPDSARRYCTAGWKRGPIERELRRYLLPFFGAMHVAKIERADVRRWFDSLSGTPGNANRTLPVLSVMLRQAELWDLRPQGSNPCRNMRRYKMPPRERFLSMEELKRLGFVLDHAEDKQTAAAVRLLLFTGARSSEITGLRWDWIRGTRAVLPDSKTGPKSIQLPVPARAVLSGLAREGRFVFPNKKGDGPMKDIGLRWQKLRNLAGLDDVRIHDLRHTFASHAVMSGLDLYTVGRLLGHADTASTERYAHLADEHVREAAGRISGIVHSAMTGNGKEGAR